MNIEVSENGSIVVTGDALQQLIERAKNGEAVAIGDGAIAVPGSISIGKNARIQSKNEDGNPSITFVKE